MRKVYPLAGIAIALFLSSCGENQPGTMGGESGTPKTVATGAPAQAAKDSGVSNPHESASRSEHAMSTFDDSTSTNAKPATMPQASTGQARPNTTK